MKRGLVIVVEGTDGSGKSFIINAITPQLEKMGYEVVYNHLRPNLMPDIAVVLGKRKPKREGEITVVSDPQNGKQSGFVGSMVRWLYYMIDYTIGYMMKVWRHKEGRIFVFDRYYYEFYLDPKRSHTRLPQWILRCGESLIPTPDCILCLGGDPAKIYMRKPETNLEEVSRQVKELKAFCEERYNAVWIDTTIDPQQSIDAAMAAVQVLMTRNR